MREDMEADMEARAHTAVLAMNGLIDLFENQIVGQTPDAETTAALMRVVFAQVKTAIPKYQGQYHGPRCNDD